MNLSLAEQVGRRVHRPAVMATVQKELGVDRPRAQRLVDGAVGLLLPEMNSLVRNDTRRNALFNLVRQADNTLEQRLLHDNHRESALADTSSLLQSMLGRERPQQLLSMLQSNESASDSEAELAMAFAASGTLASLQTKIVDGTGYDNAAGFATLLTDTGSAGQGGEAGITSDSLTAQAYLNVEEPDENRWLRYLLPLMLLALLLVTTLKACNESDQNALLSQERDQLQQTLKNTQIAASNQTDKLNAVSRDYDTAKLEITDLQNAVQENRAELSLFSSRNATTEQLLERTESEKEQYKIELAALQTEHASAMAEIEKYASLPTDTVALQERLLRTESERDQSADKVISVNQSLQDVSAELQDALQLNESLQGDLSDAQQNTKTQTDTIAALEKQVNEATGKHEQALQRLATTRESLEKLQASTTQEITTLEGQIKTQENRIGELLPRLTALNGEVEALTTARDESAAALDEANATIDTLLAGRKEDANNYEAQINTLQTLANNALEARDNSDVELGEQLQLVATQTAQIEELTDLDTSKTLEISTLTNQISEQQSRITELQQKRDELIEEVATITADKDGAVAALDEANANIEILRTDRKAVTDSFQSQVNTLQSQMNNALEARNTADSALGEQLQQVDTLSAQIEELQAEVNTLQQEKAEAETQVTALQQSATESSENITRSQSQIASLENAVNQRENQIADTETELNKTRDELAAITDERNKLLATRDKLSVEEDELAAENQSIHEQLSAVNKELNASKEALLSANSSTDELTAKLKDAEANLTQVTDKLKEAEGSNASISDQLQSAKDEIDQQKAAIQAGADSDDNLKAQLKESQQRVATLTDDNSVQKQTIADLEEQAAQLRAQYEQNNSSSAKTISSLEESVASSDNQVKQLTAEVNALRDKIVNAQAQAGDAARNTLEVRDNISRHIAESDLRGISVEAVENNTAVAITVGPGNIYRKGEVALSREGTVVLSKIAKILADYPQWQIDVEGHTDATPIGKVMRKRYPSNWELSVARASVVVKYLNLVSDVDSQSMSARGYADTRPVASNASAAGRRQNRRVDIVLRRPGE